jgi:hypothetical protein
MSSLHHGKLSKRFLFHWLCSRSILTSVTRAGISYYFVSEVSPGPHSMHTTILRIILSSSFHVISVKIELPFTWCSMATKCWWKSFLEVNFFCLLTRPLRLFPFSQQTISRSKHHGHNNSFNNSYFSLSSPLFLLRWSHCYCVFIEGTIHHPISGHKNIQSLLFFKSKVRIFLPSKYTISVCKS